MGRVNDRLATKEDDAVAGGANVERLLDFVVSTLDRIIRVTRATVR